MSKIAVLIAIFCLTSVFGRPAETEAEFANQAFTVEKLDAILTTYSANIKDYFPDYVSGPIAALTADQKSAMVQMVNDYHAGQFEPANFDAFLAVIKKSYPSLVDFYEPMHQKYEADVQKLGPKAKQFAIDMEAKMYTDASPDRIVWACNIFNNAQSTMAQAKALLLDDSEAAQIEANFPEAVKFMNSKQFQAYGIIVNNLKPLDCTKDRDQVFNTIKLFEAQSGR